MAYASEEPFGGYVDDYRSAIGAAAFVNANRAPPEDGKESPPPVTPYQFIPWRPESKPEPIPEPPVESPEELSRKIKAMLNRKSKSARKHGD